MTEQRTKTEPGQSAKTGTGQSTEDTKLGRLRSVPPRLWLTLALVAVAALFVMQNRNDTEIHLFLVSVTSPQWLTLLCSVIVGILIGLLAKRRSGKG